MCQAYAPEVWLDVGSTHLDGGSTHLCVGSVQEIRSPLQNLVSGSNPHLYLSAFINKCLSLIWCAYLTPTHSNEKGLMGWHGAFFCQEGWAMLMCSLYLTCICKSSRLLFNTVSFGLLANVLCVSAGSEVDNVLYMHSSTMPLQFRNLMTSCVINMKGTSLTKAGDRSSWSLSTLKRKGKITTELVIEENSNIRSNRSTVSSLSFLTSITNMKNPERPKS